MPDRQAMQRASDFDPEVLLVFDQYVHGDIDRRTFLARVGRFAVGTVTAAGLLGALSPRFAEAQQIAPDDERLDGRYVEYDSPKGYGRARGYLVRPVKASGPLPLVLVGIPIFVLLIAIAGIYQRRAYALDLAFRALLDDG